MAAISFTGRQLLTRAAQVVGIVGQAETLGAADAQDSLAICNGLIDRWQTQRLTLSASTRSVFSFTDNVNTYSIGAGATFNITRPIGIDYAAVENYVASPTFEIPLTALDDQSYAAIPQKGLTAAFPSQYYYNAVNALTGSLFFWPTPTAASTYRPVLYLASPLDTVALDTTYTLAPGYYAALYYNLAEELEIAFQRPPNPKVQLFAERALKDLKRNNLQMVDLVTPGALPGTDGIYNSYSDTNY